MRWHDLGALPEAEQDLLQAARRASVGAVCGYSGFPVGAAVRAVDQHGQAHIVTGSNYETINYSSVCAEKHAIMRALSELSWHNDQGQLQRPQITDVAVYCGVAGSPQQPCGNCRQMLHEVNPSMRVLAWAGPGRGGAAHDPRVTQTTVQALLPHSFGKSGLLGEGEDGSTVVDDKALESYVVHFPKPGQLKQQAAHRETLLHDVEYLILVGSPRRARRIAQLAYEQYGADRDAEQGCYCDLTRPGYDESGREYAVYTFTLPGGQKVAAVSHGIGESGAEIVLGELPALIALYQGGRPPRIKGVLRCGTRGTLARVPLGCVALTTQSHNDGLDALAPDAAWVTRLRQAAQDRQMEVIHADALASLPEADWPKLGTGYCVEGSGISTRFFWEGQGRPLYRAQALNPQVEAADQERRAAMLHGWHQAGIRWVEMEDYAVLRVAAMCGYPAVTLGAVIANRRNAQGAWQLDYSKEALAASELLPAELALAAIAL